MTTIKEIAQKSGYSSATVSRLLNNDPNLSITLETRNKIIKVANELGYLKKKRNQTNVRLSVALLYRVNGKEHLQDEYFEYLKDNVRQAANKENIELTVFTDIEDLIKKANLYQGFIGVGTAKLTYKNLKKLHEVLPNGVFIDINPAPHLFDSVQPNLALTVADAMQLLKDNHINSVGFIGTESFNLDQVPQKDIREITFTESAHNLNFKKARVFVGGVVSAQNGYHLGKKALAACKNDLPQAFVVASDTLSVGVLQAFNEAGINIPNDVSLISINNSEIAKYVSPPLTSYNIDQNEMSKQALRILVDSISDPKRPRIHLTINTNLVRRKSF